MKIQIGSKNLPQYLHIALIALVTQHIGKWTKYLLCCGSLVTVGNRNLIGLVHFMWSVSLWIVQTSAACSRDHLMQKVLDTPYMSHHYWFEQAPIWLSCMQAVRAIRSVTIHLWFCLSWVLQHRSVIWSVCDSQKSEMCWQGFLNTSLCYGLCHRMPSTTSR
jgi:hypothetical protein